MKRTVLFLFVMLVAFSGRAQSQSVNVRAHQLMQQLRDKMKFTDTQVDSTIAAEMDFLRSWKRARNREQLNGAEKKARLKALKAIRDERLAASLQLPKDKLKKLSKILPDQLIK